MLAHRPFERVLATYFSNWEGSPWIRHMGWRGCLTADDQEIVPEVRGYVLAEDIYEKHQYSAASPGLVDALRKSGMQTAYVCGFDTDACVLATVLDLFCGGFDVKVIEDCCASSNGAKAHEAGVAVIRNGIGAGNVIPMADIIGACPIPMELHDAK